MFQNMIDYAKGYVKIRFFGIAPERFLALCSANEILFWDLIYKEESYVCCVRISDFFRLKPYLKKTQMRVRVLERRGLPFLMHKHRKRIPFCIGIFLCLSIYMILSTFIWNIQVSGNSKYTTSVIIKYLSEQNIYCGVKKSQIDCEELENALRTRFEDIIWASVRINGSNLEVDIQENLYVEGETNESSQEEAENADDENTESGTDLVAKKDALIVSMITRAGTPVAAQGMQVKEGDVLVSGRLEIYNDAGEVVLYHYVDSDADIYGQVSLQYKSQIPLAYKKTTYTGNVTNGYELLLGNRMITLPHLKYSYDSYDLVMEQTSLFHRDYFNIPMALRHYQAREYVVTDETYTEAQVRKKAEQEIYVFCENLIEKGVQIVENNVIIDVDEKMCTASGEIIVMEPIGVQKETEIIQISRQEEEGTAQDESE